MDKDELNQILTIMSIEFPKDMPQLDTAEFNLKLEFWHNTFKDYDSKAVLRAFQTVMVESKFCPKIADIMEYFRRLESAGLKSEEELWDEFVKAAYKANNLSGCFRYTIVEANGRTQGENARIKAQETYDNLSPEIKAFCANVSELIAYGEMDLQQFVKPQFIKRVPHLRERARFKEESKQFFERLGGCDIKRIGTN